MRFGRHRTAEEAAAPEAPPAAPQQVVRRDDPQTPELFVRYARKDGQLVAVLRAVDRDGSCEVAAEVYPRGRSGAVRPGPYTFADAHAASAFVTEAVTALMYLGCDVRAE